MEAHEKRDPITRIKKQMAALGFEIKDFKKIESDTKEKVKIDFEYALHAEDPSPDDLFLHDFAPSPISKEKGERFPKGNEKIMMVDAALFAIGMKGQLIIFFINDLLVC